MKNRVASAMVAILVVIGGVVAAAERPNVVVMFTNDIESRFDENRIKRRVFKDLKALARRHKKFEIAPS